MLKKFFFIALPILFLIWQLHFESHHSGEDLGALMSENGPIELMQWVVITLAFFVSIATLLKVSRKTEPFLFGWVAIAALSCFYISGEEVSWGQHFLNWDTPSYWAVVNDQQETNLHNTTAWLDQKPRLILMIGIVLGGIIFPLLQKFKPGVLPEKYAIIYPPMALMVISFLVIGPYTIDKIVDIFARVSEVQELYMYYFILLYMLVLRRRIMSQSQE